MPDPRVAQPAPKKKRVRKRNRPTNATGAIVTGAKIEPQGSGVKADSKPASSSSTTKSVSVLHATTVSKPPTSTSAPVSSSKSPTTATPTSSVTLKTKNGSKSRKQKNRVTESETTQNPPRQMLTAGTPPILNGPPTLIDQYFSRGEFKGFSYNPMNMFMHEFDRLSASMGWDEDTKLRLRRYDEFLDILVSQFILYYGIRAEKLKPWQELCQAIGIDPPPVTLEGARNVVCRAHVNIIDLIEYKRSGTAVTVFSNAAELQAYTKSTRKIFPSHHPKSIGVLKYLTQPPHLPTSPIVDQPGMPPFAAFAYKFSSDAELQVYTKITRPSHLPTSPVVNRRAMFPSHAFPYNYPFSESSSGCNRAPPAALHPDPSPNPSPDLVPDSYVDEFFSQYPEFSYDPSKPIMEQYFKMCHFFGWEKGDSESDEAWDKIRTALVLQFNKYFGDDPDSLDSWVALCIAIGINPVPATMVECRTTVAHKHVNILDLIENRRISTRVTVFPNVETLSVYTKLSKKYFPRDHEKAGGVLQYLLRQIRRPELEHGRDRVAESLSRMKKYRSRRRRH